MDETLKMQYGEKVAKVYEALKNDLIELDEKHTGLKDKYGVEQKASHFYHYTFQPVDLAFDEDTPNEVRQEVISVFDKHLKPTGN